MKGRFEICKINICPVYKIGYGFKVDKLYPARYCVVDKEKEIAIDIKTKLKYDYLETNSHLYLMCESSKKINGDNRVAILPYELILYDNFDLQEAENIIEQLKSNVEFKDGNEVFDNKSYLEYLKQEALKEFENNNEKAKKITKIFVKRKK